MKTKTMKIILVFALIGIVFMLFCLINNVDKKLPVNKEMSAEHSQGVVPGVQSNYCTTLVSPETNSLIEVIEESRFYKLTYEDNGYYCYFYDTNRIVVEKEGPIPKLPRINVIDERYVKIAVQAGTGLSTQWGYYYDIQTCRFSDTFQWILGESNGRVAFVLLNDVIVRDIFDETKYYKVISDFKYDFAVAIEPIVSVEFIGENVIKIKYLTGEDYKEITEQFEL